LNISILLKTVQYLRLRITRTCYISNYFYTSTMHCSSSKECLFIIKWYTASCAHNC